MLHLAIECSGIAGSVALFDADRQLDYRILPSHLSSIQSLAVTIRDVLHSAAVRQPQLISVTHGPGSFTSLRVGLATAKMLSLAWQIPIAGVDSLATIAQRASEHNRPSPGWEPVIVTVINAFRKQVFAAAWKDSLNGCCQRLTPTQVIDAAEWCQQPLGSLQFNAALTSLPEAQGKHISVSGPGLLNYRPTETAGVSLVSEGLWMPRAIDVARLGWLTFQAGGAVGAADLQPVYVRASAAEEKAGPPPLPHS